MCVFYGVAIRWIRTRMPRFQSGYTVAFLICNLFSLFCFVFFCSRSCSCCLSRLTLRNTLAWPRTIYSSPSLRVSTALSHNCFCAFHLARAFLPTTLTRSHTHDLFSTKAQNARIIKIEILQVCDSMYGRTRSFEHDVRNDHDLCECKLGRRKCTHEGESKCECWNILWKI